MTNEVKKKKLQLHELKKMDLAQQSKQYLTSIVCTCDKQESNVIFDSYRGDVDL